MIKKITDFYNRLSKREKWILYGSLFCITALFAQQLVIGPAAEYMKRLDIKISDEETSIRKSLQVLLRKDSIASEAKRFVVFLADFKKPEEQMSSFLKQIEDLASRSSVSLLYVKPGSEKEEGRIKKYYASLECEGQMEDIVSFFYQLESTADLLKIEKYNIQPKSKGTARCVMSISRMVLT